MENELRKEGARPPGDREDGAGCSPQSAQASCRGSLLARGVEEPARTTWGRWEAALGQEESEAWL